MQLIIKNLLSILFVLKELVAHYTYKWTIKRNSISGQCRMLLWSNALILNMYNEVDWCNKADDFHKADLHNWKYENQPLWISPS